MTLLPKPVREVVSDILFKSKGNGFDRPYCDNLADIIVNGLDRRGLIVMGDGVDGAAESGNELALLKAMSRRISEAVADPECPARDLAALSRRLHEVSRDISTMEERLKQENKGRTNGSTSSDTPKAGSSSKPPLDL